MQEQGMDPTGGKPATDWQKQEYARLLAVPPGGEAVTPGAVTPRPATPTAKPVGQANSTIKNVQKALNVLKYPGTNNRPLDEDGVLGRDTRFAINNYRSKNKIDVSTSQSLVYQYILADAKKSTHKPAAPKAIVTPNRQAKEWLEEARQRVDLSLKRLGEDPKLANAKLWLYNTIAPIVGEPLTDVNFQQNMGMLTQMQNFLKQYFKVSPGNKEIPDLMRYLEIQIPNINGALKPE